MDEKTEELRDIFLDVAEEETVTESQEELRGSVTDDGEDVEDRFAAVVSEMREKFSFETQLSTDELRRLVRLFYDDYSDAEIATELSCSTDAVFGARMDLHLIRDDEPPGATVAESAWETIRERPDDGASTLADELGLDALTVERTRAAIEARNRARRVSQRFRTSFEEILTDADLMGQFAADTHRDGLDDATEDAEVDVEF